RCDVRKPDPGRIAPLARLKVGTKLMLLVLLPVCVLLGFTGFTALADWHAASQLQDFRAATRLSFATAGVAGQLATERTAAAMARLRPGAQAQAGLGAAQRDVNQAYHSGRGALRRQLVRHPGRREGQPRRGLEILQLAGCVPVRQGGEAGEAEKDAHRQQDKQHQLRAHLQPGERRDASGIWLSHVAPPPCDNAH
ncbi:MAG TPA: hypothetical protein VE888_25875, partial [Streptosporangiaceae bacterium]|nr:hypothetical protein [Streptosporangiaceae bacterium]